MSENYAIAPIEGIPEHFLETFLRQHMANRYMRFVPVLTQDGAAASATATWETDWPDDPEPRTIERADEAVDDDLAYWGED